MHHTSQGMYKKDILAKSINLEVFKTTIGCLLIFFLLVIASRLVGYYEQATVGLIDPAIIWQVIALRIPDFITLLIPLSFFLGVLITTSRLYGDNEVYAIFSSGKSLLDIIKYLLPQALLFILITGMLSLNVAPYTKALSKELLASKTIYEKIQTIKSDELTEISKNNFLKLNRSEERKLTDIFYITGDIDTTSLVIADELIISEIDDSSKIIFNKGKIYTDVKNPGRQLITNFDEFEYDFDKKLDASNKSKLNKVYDFSENSKNASFQWNISIPLTILNLLLIGVFVGRIKPRQGRLGGIMPGLFIYMLYISLLVLSRESIMSNGFLSPLGLWWVHISFLGISTIYFIKYYYNYDLNILSSSSLPKKYILIIFLIILFMWLLV
tara:strand:+ start:1560 stop:2711 length:1152 start_codon:yes stop_codon:yes gene_type:complete